MPYPLLRPILFSVAPERAHRLTMGALSALAAVPGGKPLLRASYSLRDSRLERTVAGLHFANPVGLAAGFDKDACHVPALAALGFGHIEVGTVTPVGQPGNDPPRVFRLKADNALVNRMGFNNAGADAMAARLAKLHRPYPCVLGVSIGKNKNTPLEEAARDYQRCVDALLPYADYFAVNISSPNTPELRKLQNEQYLADLLGAVQLQIKLTSAKHHRKSTPVFLKISPDETDDALAAVAAVAADAKLAGLIATNTTLARDNLQSPQQTEQGGLSGAPLTQRALHVIEHLRRYAAPGFALIASGGVMTPQDCADRLAAGADLVQLYTGFVYRGPAFPKQCLKKLLA